jgi:hypothetical protein
MMRQRLRSTPNKLTLDRLYRTPHQHTQWSETLEHLGDSDAVDFKIRLQASLDFRPAGYVCCYQLWGRE